MNLKAMAINISGRAKRCLIGKDDVSLASIFTTD
jgi:hypothetical protein